MLERYHNIGGHLRLDPEGTLTSYADAQATIADLQGQVEAARKKVEEMNAWVSAMSTANIATMAHTSEMQERALEAEQRVAQLEAWQDGVVKAFVDAPLEWSPSLGVPHIPTCLPQIFRNMKDAEHTRPDDFILLKTGEGWMAHTYNYWAKFATEEEARAYIALLEYRASLPAQGGAKCVWVDDEGGIYQTGCKHAFMVDPDSDEPPIWIKFCCYCGSLVEFFVPAAEGETRA